MTGDRAVSEVLGFILVFAVIVSSIGIVYGLGFPAVDEYRYGEQSNSAERAFEALAVGIDDLQRDRGPNRAMDINLGDRSLSIDHGPTLNVTAGGEHATASGTLVYGDGEQTEIAYASGAVIREDDVSYVVREPRFRCADEHAMVSLVSLDGPSASISTPESIRIVAEQQNVREDRLAIDADGDVNVTIEDPRYEDAWERYFEDHDDWEWDEGERTATCPGVDRALIRVTEIELEYLT